MPKSIKGYVTTSRAANLHETLEIANKLMDQELEDIPEKSTDNKRKWEDHSKGNNSNSQNKRQEVAKA